MTVTDSMLRLQQRFRDAFDGLRPAWLVNVPGRVNLIGEHTDYNGFPVMPMAVSRAIRIAAAPHEGRQVELVDAEPERYPPRSFALARTIPPYPAGDWGNYPKAAVQSLVRLALQQGRAVSELRGLRCLVEGDLPPAAGLSSSTALVVAAGLAFAAANGLELSPEEMADRMAAAEHYVGTRGGGMDQAACLLSRAGEVLKVDFFPLRVARLPFPQGYAVVAAHSGVSAAKTRRAMRAFNRRVLECRLGCHLLAHRLGLEAPPRLADLTRDGSGPGLSELSALLEEALRGGRPLSIRQAAMLLEEPVERLAALAGTDGELHVLRRCRHVFTEAVRTEQAAACLRMGAMEQLGRLMDESHRSCALDYEISCPELDELVELMRAAGALGARLTGAGFGGFAIALAEQDRLGQITDALQRRFYGPRGLPLANNLYIFQPSSGAVLRALD